MRTTTVIEQTTVGNRSHVTEVTRDDPAQAIAAVERLNGRDRSTIAFDASDATVMTIGGGHDGRYVVFIASDRRRIAEPDGTRSTCRRNDRTRGGRPAR
ncbi:MULTISPECIES: hypothetical protein [Burkholderia]|uniref:hypothetical protein n=1 Tax=Burkholderia TaxID=32008 RepID=UPI00264CE1CE|nr:hypothetical protein [Burkholderia seminalis]MDN7853000.1 hypothetical protein [Burkholderia seminalis]